MNARARAVALVLGCLVATTALAEEVRPEDLPARAQSLRDAGVDADQVREALHAARAAKLSAGDAAALLDASLAPVEEHGPVEGFGAFVKEQLDAGLRGPELASAIQAEHAKRGLGKGKPPPEPAGAAPRPGPHPPPRPAPATRPVPAPPPPRPAAPTPPPTPRTKVKSKFKPAGRTP